MAHVTQHLADIWFHHACALVEGGGPYGGTGDSTPFMGRVSQSTKRVEGATGQELITDTIVRCPLEVQASAGDKVDLPAPFSGRWEIIATSTHDAGDLPLPAHRKLMLQPQGSTSTPDPGDGDDGPYGDGPYGGGPYG